MTVAADLFGGEDAALGMTHPLDALDREACRRYRELFAASDVSYKDVQDMLQPADRHGFSGHDKLAWMGVSNGDHRAAILLRMAALAQWRAAHGDAERCPAAQPLRDGAATPAASHAEAADAASGGAVLSSSADAAGGGDLAIGGQHLGHAAADWSVDDVVAWLHQHGLSAQEELFRQKGVTGAQLADLATADLKYGFGVVDKLHWLGVRDDLEPLVAALQEEFNDR